MELHEQSKDGAGVCYFCLPVGLHVCDKRERPLPLFAQCVLSECVPSLLCCLCTCLRMPSSHQTMRFACIGVSRCLCIALSESVDDTSRLSEISSGSGSSFFFLYHSSLPLT